MGMDCEASIVASREVFIALLHTQINNTSFTCAVFVTFILYLI